MKLGGYTIIIRSTTWLVAPPKEWPVNIRWYKSRSTVPDSYNLLIISMNLKYRWIPPVNIPL